MRLVHIAESGALAGRCVLSRLDVGLSGLPRLALRLAFPKLGLNGRAAQRVDRHSRFAGNFNLRRDDRRPRYSLLRQRGRVPAQRLSRLYSRDKAAAFGTGLLCHKHAHSSHCIAVFFIRSKNENLSYKIESFSRPGVRL